MSVITEVLKPVVPLRARHWIRRSVSAIFDPQVSGPKSALKTLTAGPIGLLPDFLLIGAQKCGTTSLYSYLTKSPYIYKAAFKEVGYFDRYYHSKNLPWYRSQFPSYLHKNFVKRFFKEHFVTGEASTGYILNPRSLRRIAKTVPEAKLILLLRNPIDRAYSHHHHTTRMGLESLSFEEAIELEKERIGTAWDRMLEDDNYYNFDIALYAYLATGIYADQVQVLIDLFPRDQILFVKSEDFFKDPLSTVIEVLDFLNLPHWRPNSYKILNEGKYSRMDRNTREKLREFFEPHNRRLYKCVGRDFGW